jgi:hypothetical protein
MRQNYTQLVRLIIVIAWFDSPMKAKAYQLTADFTSTCQKIEVNGHSVSLMVTWGQPDVPLADAGFINQNYQYK